MRSSVGGFDRRGDIGLGGDTASRSDAPLASSAAMADDSVQPVPWVLRVVDARRLEAQHALAIDQDIDGLVPFGMAALDQHGLRAEPPKRLGLRRHLLFVARLADQPRSFAASGRFGVIRRRARHAARCEASRRRPRREADRRSPRPSPDRARPARRGKPSSPSATASITALVASMPILMAPTSRSRATARSARCTKSGGTTSTASTPCVFCAVSAVIALAP